MKKIVLPCSPLFESVIYGEYVDGEDDSKDDGAYGTRENCC